LVYLGATLSVATNRETDRQHTKHDHGEDEKREDRDEHDATLGPVTRVRKSRRMPTCTDPSPRSVVEALRGDRGTRPRADLTSASGLRSILEDGIFALLHNVLPATPIVLRASSLRQLGPSTDISESAHARVRGILVNHVLRLLSVGAAITDPFEDALRAWRLEVESGELLDFVERLQADDLARLATDVTAHSVTLMRSLGPVNHYWLPRSAMRATQMLCGGSVILRDVIDLMVGTTVGEFASVALFDVTTSPLGEGAERALRYHALVQTLRSGVVPLRTSCFSTATGEMWSLDVDGELLTRSADEVLCALANITSHA
jgi:hypothetical protein